MALLLRLARPLHTRRLTRLYADVRPSADYIPLTPEELIPKSPEMVARATRVKEEHPELKVETNAATMPTDEELRGWDGGSFASHGNSEVELATLRRDAAKAGADGKAVREAAAAAEKIEAPTVDFASFAKAYGPLLARCMSSRGVGGAVADDSPRGALSDDDSGRGSSDDDDDDDELRATKDLRASRTRSLWVESMLSSSADASE